MSGPIVRSAPNKKFTANWDSVFGNKSKKDPSAKDLSGKGKGKPAAKKIAKKKKT